MSKGHRKQEQCSHDSNGHDLDPHKPRASHTSIYLQVIPDLSVSLAQAAVMHSRCACFSLTGISVGPQAGRPGCTIREKKEKPLPSLQFTLQLEGCLQNSILPQPLPKTTRVKRIYISELPSSLIFILFLHVLIALIYFNLETA